MPSNRLTLCCPLLLLPSIFPSIKVFSSESILHIKWPKYWSFSFSISPSNEYSGLISFRVDWLDLLAVQGALKSLLQHHSSNVSSLWCSSLLQSNSHTHTWLVEKTQLWLHETLLAKLCLCFTYAVWVGHSFSSKEQASFNFMAAVTNCSDFGASPPK